MAGEGLLLMANRNGAAGVVGAFHAQFEGDAISGYVTADDAGLTAGQYARWCVDDAHADFVSETDALEITLNELQWKLVHYVPVDNGVAALGLLNKLNGVAAVGDSGWQADGSYVVELSDGGTIGIACEQQPAKIMVDGAEVTWSYEGNIARCEVEAGAAVRVQLFMA